ncbi:MAG: hypothetical protein M1340_00005 [Actinobacteria bacterium]|jgi:hypothetical protein|nr:hypothetical protein [Actinomycetota bacterium]MCL6092213.1 hypothetical protein [Actinomycetota bacterium]
MKNSQNFSQELNGAFDLSISRKPGIQHFFMQTQFIHIGFDGRRTGSESYMLKLRCTPGELLGEKLDQYTCHEFGLQLDDKNITTIPALKLWDYQFDLMSGINEGSVFGIPHEQFEDLVDSKGNRLTPDIRYAVYNNFIDFHSLNDIFSRPMFGKGIEQLKNIGNRIVHASAFIETPLSLGTAIKPGSVFKNGEVTLELKGISVVNGSACALVGYDSGESTLKMTLALSNNQDAITEGGSEYKGDIYIDLETGWVKKATLDEFVVTETKTTSETTKTHQYSVRHLFLRLISEQEFKRGLVS